jgi:hypothetical protein
MVRDLVLYIFWNTNIHRNWPCTESKRLVLCANEILCTQMCACTHTHTHTHIKICKMKDVNNDIYKASKLFPHMWRHHTYYSIRKTQGHRVWTESNSWTFRILNSWHKSRKKINEAYLKRMCNVIFIISLPLSVSVSPLTALIKYL